MRQARFKMEGTTGVYHCVTRTVAGEMLLRSREKEVLRKMLWQVADFSGVEILAYCIMTNHFHVLLRVSGEGGKIPGQELLRRYRSLYFANASPNYPDPEVMAQILEEDSEQAAQWEERLSRRMQDVSEFMKTLKQRFSIWYNKTHSRFGTLWAERFKSTIVENDPVALKMVAGYIDLNPIRAGLVADPANYRWSSYGEAMGGLTRAQSALSSVLGMPHWKQAADHYRMVLYGKGANGRTGEQGLISHKLAMEILGKGGKIPRSSLLRCRIRYLTDGAIFGSREFVQHVGAELCGAKMSEHQVSAVLPAEEEEKLVAWRRLRLCAIG